MKRLVFTAFLGTVLLFAAAPAMAQIGDLAGTTPCCAKVCNGTTSTRCGDLIATGLSKMLSGCAGIDDQIPATCVGGQLLDAGPQALLDGCACVLGSCFGPISQQFAQFTSQECTDEAVRACGETGNVVVTENDADCAPPVCNNDGTCDAGENCANCTADCACTGGDTCENGVCTPPPVCNNDGTCDAGENCANCTADCACTGGDTCENGVCTPPPVCNNDGTCDAGEDCANCAADCACQGGDTCENGVCTPPQCVPEGQTCETGAHAKLVCCSALQCIDNRSGTKRCVTR